MKNYRLKYLNKAYTDELDELWKDHGEAIAAYGLECANAYGKGIISGMHKVGCALVIAAVVCGVVKGVKELKEEKKPTEKPGRVWEA